MAPSSTSNFTTKFAAMMFSVTAYTPFRTMALCLNSEIPIPRSVKVLYRPFISNFLCTHQLAVMQYFYGVFNQTIYPQEEKSSIQKIAIAAISGAASTPTTTPCEFLSLMESNKKSGRGLPIGSYWRGSFMMTARQSLLGIGSLALPEIFSKQIQYYFPDYGKEYPISMQMGCSFAGSGVSSIVSQLPEVARVKMQLNPDLTISQAVKDSWKFMKTEKGIKAAGYRFVVIAIALTVYRTSTEVISQCMSRRRAA